MNKNTIDESPTEVETTAEIMSIGDFTKQYASPDEVKQTSKAVIIKFADALKNLARR